MDVIVIPTYNERDSAPKLIEQLLQQTPEEVHLLVVDDSSPDGTVQVITDKFPSERVHLLSREKKEGLGRAYIDGFKWALEHDAQLIMQMDADLSHRAVDAVHLLQAAGQADLIIGSRYVPGGHTKNWNLPRRIISRAANLYTRMWLSVGVRDLTGGFKCFHREVLEQIDLDQVAASGYEFQAEMTFRAASLGFTTIEVPITFADRQHGASKASFKTFIEFAVWLPLIRLRYWRSEAKGGL